MTSNRRSRVQVGQLSDDFLRLQVSPSVNVTQNQADGNSAAGAGDTNVTLYSTFVPPRTRGRLVITILEANLTKNYGLVRMDPYCRLRVGSGLFETPTDPGGGKTPKWNRSIQCYLPDGLDSIYLEIFDERAFSFDERIAWAHILLPKAIFDGQAVNEWFPLSGNQGDGKEGVINLLISLEPIQMISQQQPVLLVPVISSSAFPTPPRFTQADVKELHDMFPNVDEEIIVSILESKNGNKEATINDLLDLNSE
ncbi:Toll-interacting protein [Trichinella spiralis]|uniref:Toll-interacting protein n=2 Tax=Trichinella spiralis TaxID=6334 RepID=E5S3Q5_TRISP|nr:toll-interacting protein [Trichinella spiralis]KRY35828.1 Toll-interacting protein [Trichinella spiralis]